VDLAVYRYRYRAGYMEILAGEHCFAGFGRFGKKNRSTSGGCYAFAGGEFGVIAAIAKSDCGSCDPCADTPQGAERLEGYSAGYSCSTKVEHSHREGTCG